jgi:peptidyl-tRNA hydrolase
MDPAAYVLQDFSKADQPLLSELLDKAVAAVECYLTDGIDLAMSRYNGSVVAGAEPATE